MPKTANGCNPMRYRCRCKCGGQPSRCFNVEMRPKIEVFADCFPRKINFGDIDGIVEMGGAFAVLEWKRNGGSLRTAQSLLFKRLTTDGRSAVFVAEGNPKTMAVDRYCIFWNGKQNRWQKADLDHLKIRIRNWVCRADEMDRLSRYGNPTRKGMDRR